MMIGIESFVILCLLIIIIYPALNTHEDIYTIENHYITPGVYHIQTNKITLNVSDYYLERLVEGRTYRIKWVDGLYYDRIAKIEEIEK